MRPTAKINAIIEAIDARASVFESHAEPSVASGSLSSGPLELAPSAPRTLTSPPSGASDLFPEMIAWNDGFLAVWNRQTTSGQCSVHAQKFDADGDAVGGVMTIQAAAVGIGGKPEIVDVGGGKVAVFWQTGTDLKGAFLNPDTGALTGTKTVVTNAADWMHDVVRLSNGDIAMATAQYDGIQADINLLILNDANLAEVSKSTLDTFSAGSNTYDHTITRLGTGGVMLFRNRDNNQLYAQKFTAAGATPGDPVKINTTAISLPTLFDMTYFRPQAVELQGGGYVAVWSHVEGSGGDRIETRARVFDAAGEPVAKDFLVNSTPAGNQYDAQVVALAGGKFAISWTSDVGFVRTSMIRYFDSDGKALTGDIVTGTPSIFTSFVDHQTAVLSDGSIADLYPEGGFTALAVDGIKPPTFGGAAAETLNGTAGEDVILAGGGNDTLNLQQGGNDVANGEDGADTFNFGNNYTSADTVDGGAQADVLKLDGASYGNLSLQPNFINIEKILLAAGNDYTLVLHNSNVAAGKSMMVDGSALGANDVLNVFGNAETDGTLALIGGAAGDSLFGGTGADTLRGNGGNDVLHVGTAGNDTARGDAGDDVFNFSTSLNPQDVIDGGDGADTLNLIGNYQAGVAFKDTTIVDVEKIALGAGYTYNLTLHNSNVALGDALTIDGSALASFNSLRVDGSGETNARLVLIGGAGADSLIGGRAGDRLEGGAGVNTLDASFGGKDVVIGGVAQDTILMGAAFTADDKVDGGGSSDELRLTGNYSGGVVLKATSLVNIETVTLGVGFDYRLTLHNGNAAAATTLQIGNFSLGAGDNAYVDGSRELDAKLHLFTGSGADTLIGGLLNDTLWGAAGADLLNGARGGNDYISAGTGEDVIMMGKSLTTLDRIDGGGNFFSDTEIDTVILDGDYSTLVEFDAFTMIDIEKLSLKKGNDYNLRVYTEHNNIMTVDGSKLEATDVLTLSATGGDGSRYVYLGGAAADSLKGGAGFDSIDGGAGNDRIDGGGRADSLRGGLGADTFVWSDNGYSEFDNIEDLAMSDEIDVSAYDANSTLAGDQAFVFIGDAEFSGDGNPGSGVAGEMRIVSFGGNSQLHADTNGDGNADVYLFTMTGDKTDFSNFVL